MAQVTLNKGGTAEKTVDSKCVDIPDLWHIAERLRESGEIRDADTVLECWHLAHSLLVHINSD